MKIHPNEPTLQELFEQLSRGSLRTLEHVLACPECREQARKILTLGRRPAPGNLLQMQETKPVYESLLEEAGLTIRCRQLSLEQERLEAQEIFPGLEACPAERRALLLRNSARHQSWGMLELVLERSRRASFNGAFEVQHWAEMALLIADQLDPEHYGAANVEDMRARAWSRIGNARRIEYNFVSAEEAFRTALTHLRQGSGDPVERAHFLSLRASLLRVQAKFSQAMSLLRRAIEIFEGAGETHQAGRCLVQLSAIYVNNCDPAEAVPLVERAMDLIDKAREPQLEFFAWNNLIIAFAQVGRNLEAAHLLSRTLALYEQSPIPSARARLSWAKGKIARGYGQFHEAEENLIAARTGFLSVGILCEAAVVSLELASLYHDQGRSADIRLLAEELTRFSESPQVSPDVREALTSWQEGGSGAAPTPPTPSPSRGTPRPHRQSRR